MTYLLESELEPAVFEQMVDQALTKILVPLTGKGGTTTAEKIADAMVQPGNYQTGLRALVKKLRYANTPPLRANSTDAVIDAAVLEPNSVSLLKQLLGVTGVV